MDKSFFIPGWLDFAERHGYERGMDIWKGDRILPQKIEGPVVAHSAGALYVLERAGEIQSVKIILINPLIPHRSLLSWLYRWLKYVFSEGTDMSWKRLSPLLSMFPNSSLLVRLLRIDFRTYMQELGPERLVFIRGERDYFFFDEQTAEKLKQEGFTVVTVRGAGHNFDAAIRQAVEDLITTK